jgi:A118 family predicted phage portal protein
MKLIDKAVGRVLEKIKSDSAYEYNNIITPDRTAALRDRYTRSVLINSVWYGGSDIELKQLYERDLKGFRIGQVTSDELNYFWGQATQDTNIRKIHSGIPQLISEKMVDLIIANGYELNVYKDDKREEDDEDNLTRLHNILEDNMFDSILQEAIETESWSGGVAIKLSVNNMFDYPIIEVIQPEEYEPVVKAGRIIEDIFIKYFDSKGASYKLKECYGTDGTDGYIRYKMFRLVGKNESSTWVEASLKDVEETKDLKDIVFKGVKKKFSIYKPNKLPNSEFRGSRLGESDYSGSHGMFDAIDEIYSTMVQEFRDGKIKNFWPSNLLPTDPLSNNKQYIPPSLKKDYIVYTSGIGEKEKPDKVEMVQGEIHSEKYIEAFKKSLEIVLNNAGLSPQTIGLTGLDSTAASEESQELREKTSIRTREKKIQLWRMTLNELFEMLLILDDVKNGRTSQDYYVDVLFNDYKIQTLDDKTKIASAGIVGKTWDIMSAVRYVHDEMPEEEQILTAIKIKIENGVNVFTKEEELIYRKFVSETLEETPQEQDDIEEIDDEIDDEIGENIEEDEEVNEELIE